MVSAADQRGGVEPAAPVSRATFVAARGELRRATTLALEVLERADATAEAVAAARVTLAIVARSQDRLADARTELDLSLAGAEAAECAGIVAVARLEQALVASNAGAHLEAIGTVVDVDRRIAASGSEARLRPLVDVVDAVVHLAGGDVDRAEVLVDRLPVGAVRSLVGARIALARGRDDVALAIAERVLRDEEPDLRRQIEALGVASRAEGELGAHHAARRRLARAVELAAPEGHVRVFIDLGLDPPGIDGTHGHAPAWLVLSTREQQVLRLLRRRLDNREIGAAMYISVNTVKTHLQSIYRKLGVASRREAVERAHDHGLL